MNDAIILLSTAAILGFRHGFDWDHIAAIMDLVSSSSSTQSEKHKAKIRALTLSSMYALGHAMLVLTLGASALLFATILPNWIDAVMERIVGVTLLLLGAWVSVALVDHFKGKSEFRLQSRWMLLFEMFAKIRDRFSNSIHDKSSDLQNRSYGLSSSFCIGMLHGIGAETGTQVLLIAAIGGAASRGLGMAMLISFIAGLLASNTIVAIAGITGFNSSAKIKPLYLTAGALTCIFSLIVGTYFVTGQADALPDLQHFMG